MEKLPIPKNTQKRMKREKAPKTGRIIIKGLVCMTGVQKESRKQSRKKKIFFEEITAENLPNLVKRHTFIDSRSAYPNRINTKKTTPRYITSKLLNTKDKEKAPESFRQNDRLRAGQ